MLDANALMALPQDFTGMGEVTPQTMYLMGCRSFSQLCCTLRSLAKPAIFCPFCEAELRRREREPIMGMGEWRLYSNEFPHKATSRMELIVPKRHVTSPSELTPSDWADIGALLKVSRVKNGGLVLRFGDPRFHVGTIEHLHFNVIEPRPGVEYRAPLAKNEAEHAEDYQRMLGFLVELREHGGLQWLFSVDGITATQPKVE